jgi:hypothetical protein
MREGCRPGREDAVKGAYREHVIREPDLEGPGRFTGRGLVIGLFTPAIATVVAFPIASTRPEISIAVFMLAVVIAAVAGGLWSGLIAALLASTIRPLVVEYPQLTFRFDDVEDAATGVVFLSGCWWVRRARSGPAPRGGSGRPVSWGPSPRSCTPGTCRTASSMISPSS